MTPVAAIMMVILVGGIWSVLIGAIVMMIQEGKKEIPDE